MQISGRNTDPAVLEELGLRLRRTRLERNLSQAQLAGEAGIGRATLQRIEEGGGGSLISLVRILRALDLLDDLDRLVPEPAPSPLDELRRQGRRRQRAGSPRSPESPRRGPGPWRWDDEEVEGDD
jgi:transcriptional regulator with XRE-family HTH domain